MQPGADAGMPAVDTAECIRGRVLRVHGLASVVEADDGRIFRCAVRRLLKSLATDERSVVTTGDMVWVRPARSGDRRQEAGGKEQEKGDRRQKPEARDRRRRSRRFTVSCLPRPRLLKTRA